jgi:hypothetical protein
MGKYAHIVGNGTSTSKRSNAHTLDWEGNAWFAGKITKGGDNVELTVPTYLYVTVPMYYTDEWQDIEAGALIRINVPGLLSSDHPKVYIHYTDEDYINPGVHEFGLLPDALYKKPILYGYMEVVDACDDILLVYISDETWRVFDSGDESHPQGDLTLMLEVYR